VTTTQKPENGEAIATRPRRELSPEVQARIEEKRAHNAVAAAIRGTQWGKDLSPEIHRSIAEYCRANNLDPVRHVELLGGRIYLTAELYDEKGAHLLRSGEILPDEPDYINVDERLDKLAAAGGAEAVAEQNRRMWERIKYNAPESAKATVVQRFHIARSGAVVVGVNWCGGGSRKSDPVGDSEPAKTAQTRARRRAWKQIADIIPGYAEIIQPLEATARVINETLPVSVIDAPPVPKALSAPAADDPYDLAPKDAAEAGNGELGL
jgi:hypothetical protein